MNPSNMSKSSTLEKILLRLNKLTMRSDLIIAGFLVAIIFMMILPLPTMLVDTMIALNMGVGVLLLIVGVYMASPLEFLGFPAVLLLTTLSRLALSITTTRLILLQGDAGKMVDAFGNYVVGGNIIVGLVIFLIITIVQFLVITKGSERVAEVSARFSLDGMPGKQMSIDGDLRANLIDIAEAKRRRGNIEKESQLYGAMDGAMKFVKGDAIAGLIIIAVNLLGGIGIGVFQAGLSISDALQKYAILTIGDGLISQIPALFISITAGIIVTRVSNDNEAEKGDLGKEISGQVTRKPQAIITAGAILLFFAFVPDFPTLTFLALSAATIAIGVYFKAKHQGGGDSGPHDFSNMVVNEDEQQLNHENLREAQGMTLPLVIEISSNIRQEFKPEMLNLELMKLRKALYDDLGVPFPGIHLRFSSQLAKDTYKIVLQDVPVAHGMLRSSHLLVTDPKDQLEILSIPFEQGKEFLPNTESLWVLNEYREKLTEAGIGFLDGVDILTYHLSLVLKKYAEEFVGIQETKAILDRIEAEYPELVRETQRILPLQKIAEIYKRLVSEDISIRNQRAILESVVEWGPKEKDIVQLTEYVRSDQKRYISYKYSNEHNILPSYLLDEESEEAVRRGIRMTSAGAYLAMDPEQSQQFIKNLKKTVGDISHTATKPVLITTMDIRRFVKKLIESDVQDLPVVSLQELTQEITVQPLGRVTLEEA